MIATYEQLLYPSAEDDTDPDTVDWDKAQAAGVADAVWQGN